MFGGNKRGKSMELKVYCNEFFEKRKGTICYWRERDYPIRENTKKGILFSVKFNNANIFGQGNFRDEIFPRYRQMMIEFQEYLHANNKLKKILEANYVFDMLPILDVNAYIGESVAIKEETRKNTSSLEIVLIPNDIKNALTICKEMPEVSCVIKRCNDNHYYGVDEILYYVIAKIININPNIKRVMDIGAASGNAARMYMERGNIEKLTLVDSNRQVCEQLCKYLENRAEEKGIILEINNCDCLNCNMPTSLDVLSITVDTDSVISFLEQRHNEITQSLGNDGIFILELLNCIGDKGYSFVNMLATGNAECFKNWPWYSNKMFANRLFKYSKTMMIGNEVILVASNNVNYVDVLERELNFEYGQEYKQFVEQAMVELSDFVK